jgi:hypothetical protein
VLEIPDRCLDRGVGGFQKRKNVLSSWIVVSFHLEQLWSSVIAINSAEAMMTKNTRSNQGLPSFCSPTCALHHCNDIRC